MKWVSLFNVTHAKHQVAACYGFTLDEVVAAHEATERMSHVGKVLIRLA